MKSMIERIDPELLPVFQAYGEMGLDNGFATHEEFLEFRATFNANTDLMVANFPPFKGVDIRVEKFKSYDDATISARVYSPSDANGALPVLLWIHGGGYIVGQAIQDDPVAYRYAKNLNCVVVSVDYRLAPEFPFPTPLEDCYAALNWISKNSKEIGVDTSRIAVGGLSAGAGLAATLTQVARDRDEVDIKFQLLGYPMLDDRNITQVDNPARQTIPWTQAKNLFAWGAYLGREPGTSNTPLYAAASRTEDLEGLPPAYIYIGDLDLFLSENLEYANRLIAAGVPTDLHVYPNAVHGFDFFAPDSSIGQRCIEGCLLALKKAFQKS